MSSRNGAAQTRFDCGARIARLTPQATASTAVARGARPAASSSASARPLSAATRAAPPGGAAAAMSASDQWSGCDSRRDAQGSAAR